MSIIEDKMEKASNLRAGLPLKKNEYLPSEIAAPYLEDEYKDVHLRDYLDVLLRRKLIVIVFLALVVSIVTIFSFMMSPLYKATATIQIKMMQPDILAFKDIYKGQREGSDYYETQYKILKSRNLVERIVAKLALESKSLFAYSGAAVSMNGSLLAAEEKEENGKNISVEDIMAGLDIQPVKPSQLVNIDFISEDPTFAAIVANTVADEYIKFTHESKIEPTLQARERLQDEVEAMRVKLESSEKEINDYISKSPIFFFNKEENYNNLLTQEISTLSEKLYQSTADRISKEALYQEVKKSGVDYSFVLENSLIQSLTMEYAQLESEYFKLLRIHKPAYPKMVRLKNQIEQLGKRIEAEEGKIINTIDSDYKIALKKEGSLSSAIEGLRKDVNAFQQNMIQFQILKREVETNSDIYKSLLKRLKEVGISTALTESNIQMLDRAEVPQDPYKPNKALNLALSLVFGLLGGVFLAFFAEYFDNTVKTEGDIEKFASLPVLGVLPVTNINLMKLADINSKQNEAFTEALRSISACIKYSNILRPHARILVTSPLAGEGKTILSVSIATSFVRSFGKGIIIDADLRRPDVHNFFNLDNSSGLSSFLAGDIEFNSLIKETSYPGLDVITAGPLPSNPSELLSSPQMRELSDALSAKYDYIIIDSAPVLGMSDSLVLSSLADGVMVVAKAGITPGDALLQTKKALISVNARILGVLLNGVAAKTRYGSSYYCSPYIQNKEKRKLLSKAS